MPGRKNIPMWLKYMVTIYAALFVAIYGVLRGPVNFLWFSDIALFAIVLSLWWEKSLPASMLAVGVVLFELGWNVDFYSRLLFGSHLFGFTATGYMFTDDLPIIIRLLSFTLHLVVPVTLLYILLLLGYDRRAMKAQTALAWVILPICYAFTDPERNINWVFGIGGQQTLMPSILYLILGMLLLPVLVYYPTHRLLMHFFPNLDHE